MTATSASQHVEQFISSAVPKHTLGLVYLGNRRLTEVFLEEVLGLLAELAERGAADPAAGTGQFDLRALADVVGEVDVDDVPHHTLEERHQRAELAPQVP
ncbi:hypothetical protein BH23ACT9_BH23ACT9_17370 [soil metagenome]